MRPITLREACAFVEAHHRHHPPPRGHKFSLAIEEDGHVVGVAIVGRPVARALDDNATIEVLRVCCLPGTKNGCSMLYGAARRIAKEMGYRRILTYTLASEPGTSLKASGWKHTADVPGRSWDRRNRPRRDHHPATDKRRWECVLCPPDARHPAARASDDGPGDKLSKWPAPSSTVPAADG